MLMKKDKSNIKLIIGIIAIVLIMVLINRFNVFEDYGPNEIRDYILNKKAMGPLIYVILLTLLPLMLFPDSVLVIAGGMVFGLVWGTILTSIGSLLGGIIAFLISRKLGRETVKKLIKKDLVMFSKDNKKGGFFLILMLRLIPLFPFKLVSYSAGLSDIKLKDFSFATVVGSLPGIIVYTNLGDKTNNLGSGGFYLAIILLGALFAVSFILKKLYAKKSEKTIKDK
ncbi:TVP38/TMEM64 family protein [Tissierella creatinini]|nr:TVP38/TMEM64 family protein [Tissierella creatinini]TJX66490.1 TVP38/TMEM64 family protein [Soehngenia saccharolytica]